MADISSHATLPTNLVSYWELEEESGTRADVVGTSCGGSGCDLDDNATVLFGTGKQGNAADFEKDTSEYLSHVDHADLSITGAFSISGWWKPETISGSDIFASKWKDNSPNRSWVIDYQTGGPRLLMSPNGDNPLTVVTSTEDLSAGNWYHIVATFEPSTEMAIWVNNVVTVNTTSIPATIHDNSSQFRIGSAEIFGGSVSAYSDGLIDEVGIWDKVLSDSEISDLFNSGAGLPYFSEAVGPATLKTWNTVTNV